MMAWVGGGRRWSGGLRRTQSLFCCDSCASPIPPLMTLSFSRVSFSRSILNLVKVPEGFFLEEDEFRAPTDYA